eukprot:13079_1
MKKQITAYFSPSTKSLFSPSRSPRKAKKSTDLIKLEFEEKKNRKKQINDLLSHETALRKESEENGIVGDYFKKKAKQERPCINKECCEECFCVCKDVCCCCCKTKRRFCLILLMSFLTFLILYILTAFRIIPKPSGLYDA